MVKYRNRFKHLLVLIKHKINVHIMEKIQRKFIITLLLVMAVPLLIFLFVSINISRGTVESSEISSNISRVKLSGHYIENQLAEYDELLFSALVDENLVPSLTSDPNDYVTQLYIKDKLFNLYDIKSSIQSISLISYPNKLMYRVEHNEFFLELFHDLPKRTQNKSVSFSTDEEADTFSFERNIFRFEDQKLIGKIKININFSLFNPIINNLKSNEGEHILLLNHSGDILYNPDNINLPDKIKSLIEVKNIKDVVKENSDYFFQKAINQNIVLIKIVPEDVMNVGALHIRRSGIILIIISVILTILLSFYVGGKVTKPIIELSNAMKHVGQDNLDVKINTKRTDEIGVLNRTYKEMIYRIRDLIVKDLKHEIEKKDAQFLALQAQINPHFLYNTLQVIGSMAMKKEAKEINDMSQKLSSMFRYITKKQNGLVTLEEEVNHLKNYLYIQQVRFGEQVSIQLFVEEEVNDGLIPLLTIQPLIENCFIHGFDSKVGQWMIKIDIQKVFNEIEIIIEDNGIGISEHELITINKNLSLGQFVTRERIGIYNVNARIQLNYGEEYGIEINSKQNDYTRVIMRLPYYTEGAK